MLRLLPQVWRRVAVAAAATRPPPPPLPRSLTTTAPSLHTPEFRVIYTFPYIRAAHTVCRLKLYQTGVTCLTLPVTGYLTVIGITEPSSLVPVTCINVLALGMLWVMGEAFRRLIGRIYVSRDETQVKISHLTFWGRRHDLIVPTSDLVPLSDTSDNPADIYIRLLRYSQPPSASLFLCLRFGGVIDQEIFDRVLGKPHPQ